MQDKSILPCYISVNVRVKPPPLDVVVVVVECYCLLIIIVLSVHQFSLNSSQIQWMFSHDIPLQQVVAWMIPFPVSMRSTCFCVTQSSNGIRSSCFCQLTPLDIWYVNRLRFTVFLEMPMERTHLFVQGCPLSAQWNEFVFQPCPFWNSESLKI